jgi:hypothetical protein
MKRCSRWAVVIGAAWLVSGGTARSAAAAQQHGESSPRQPIAAVFLSGESVEYAGLAIDEGRATLADFAGLPRSMTTADGRVLPGFTSGWHVLGDGTVLRGVVYAFRTPFGWHLHRAVHASGRISKDVRSDAAAEDLGVRVRLFSSGPSRPPAVDSAGPQPPGAFDRGFQTRRTSPSGAAGPALDAAAEELSTRTWSNPFEDGRWEDFPAALELIGVEPGPGGVQRDASTSPPVVIDERELPPDAVFGSLLRGYEPSSHVPLDHLAAGGYGLDQLKDAASTIAIMTKAYRIEQAAQPEQGPPRATPRRERRPLRASMPEPMLGAADMSKLFDELARVIAAGDDEGRPLIRAARDVASDAPRPSSSEARGAEQPPRMRQAGPSQEACDALRWQLDFALDSEQFWNDLAAKARDEGNGPLAAEHAEHAETWRARAADLGKQLLEIGCDAVRGQVP